MNARYHSYTPDQMFVVHINPEYIRRHNPLVSAIDDFIDRHVSLASFSSKCINSINGYMSRYRSKCHNNFRTGKSKRFNVKREYFDSQLARKDEEQTPEPRE